MFDFGSGDRELHADFRQSPMAQVSSVSREHDSLMTQKSGTRLSIHSSRSLPTFLAFSTASSSMLWLCGTCSTPRSSEKSLDVYIPMGPAWLRWATLTEMGLPCNIYSSGMRQEVLAEHNCSQLQWRQPAKAELLIAAMETDCKRRTAHSCSGDRLQKQNCSQLQWRQTAIAELLTDAMETDCNLQTPAVVGQGSEEQSCSVLQKAGNAAIGYRFNIAQQHTQRVSSKCSSTVF